MKSYYQPIIDAESGLIVGAEVLARKYSADGLINPFAAEGVFSHIERQQLFKDVLLSSMREITSSALLTSCLARRSFFISYNVEPYFLKNNIQELIDSAIKLKTKSISMLIELVEYDDFMTDKKNLELLKIKDYCDIALDDFSTRYSSFTLLCYAEPSYIKIDSSFLSVNEYSPQLNRNLEGIILLCKHLGVNLIIEGVETLSQVKVLDEVGIMLRQGFYYHRPMPFINLMKVIG